jgi:hypothetical protein
MDNVQRVSQKNRRNCAMTTKTAKKATHTPGAIRAANAIRSNYHIKRPGNSANRFFVGDAELAEIIDRETAAPEMAEALEHVHQQLSQFLSTGICDLRLLRDHTGKVIRKARGDQ